MLQITTNKQKTMNLLNKVVPEGLCVEIVHWQLSWWLYKVKRSRNLCLQHRPTALCLSVCGTPLSAWPADIINPSYPKLKFSALLEVWEYLLFSVYAKLHTSIYSLTQGKNLGLPISPHLMLILYLKQGTLSLRSSVTSYVKLP